jgi:hypothetical protein
VDAGSDQTVVLPGSATLNGTVSDDGLPSGSVGTVWNKVSGPGTVTFADSEAVDTTATFADDGELSTSDDVTVEA